MPRSEAPGILCVSVVAPYQRFSSSSATRKASSRLCMWFRRGSHSDS
jgi:hypothetical protein